MHEAGWTDTSQDLVLSLPIVLSSNRCVPSSLQVSNEMCCPDRLDGSTVTITRMLSGRGQHSCRAVCITAKLTIFARYLFSEKHKEIPSAANGTPQQACPRMQQDLQGIVYTVFRTPPRNEFLSWLYTGRPASFPKRWARVHCVEMHNAGSKCTAHSSTCRVLRLHLRFGWVCVQAKRLSNICSNIESMLVWLDELGMRRARAI